MNLLPCSQASYNQQKPSDPFSRTFLSKVKFLDKWDLVQGAYTDEGTLLGASLLTVSQRRPHVANLQLLHTFPQHRGQGVGSFLLLSSILSGWQRGAAYFRVSSERDAVVFYEKYGLVMLGEQKSGCQLSMGKYVQEEEGLFLEFDPLDEVINKALHRKGKGGCVSLWDIPEKKRLLIGGLGQSGLETATPQFG